jgi:hypothetical protein
MLRVTYVDGNWIYFETQGRHASAKAHEIVDQMTSNPSSREEISQPEIEPPTSSMVIRI